MYTFHLALQTTIQPKMQFVESARENEIIQKKKCRTLRSKIREMRKDHTTYLGRVWTLKELTWSRKKPGISEVRFTTLLSIKVIHLKLDTGEDVTVFPSSYFRKEKTPSLFKNVTNNYGPVYHQIKVIDRL